MDAFNKTLAQLTDLFHSMTVGARITTGLLLVAVVVSLGYLFSGRVSGPEIDLMNGMPVPASHLPAMTAAFGKAKLSNFEIRGTQIFVPRGQEATYMAALAAEGVLPPGWGDVINRTSKKNGNPFVSAEERREQMKAALQEELALIISRMPGVECASVIYATDIIGGLNREKHTTATVSVKPAGNSQLEDGRVASIRHMVAGAVPGLKLEDVTIVDITGGRSYTGGDAESGTGQDSTYLRLTTTYQKNLKDQILGALSYVPNVTVTPTVILDREKLVRTREVQHDPKAVPWKTMEKSQTHSRDSSQPAGRPGYVSQSANAPATLASARGGTKEEGEDSATETVNAVGGKSVERETVGFTPKSVRVSIGVPVSYFAKVWHERNDEPGKEPGKPDKTALETIAQEETTKIRKHVAGVLPAVEGTADPTELVTVTTFQDLKSAEPVGPTVAKQALSWFGEYWSTLGVIGVALISLVMLRSLARSAPPSSSPASSMSPMPSAPRVAAGTSGGSDESREADPEVAAQSRLRRFQGGGKSLRDELSELVTEDPDVAANILKSWIGHMS